jgi:uncharacterized protein (UPF0303 family)
MTDYDEILKEIEQQEQLLQFDTFSNDQALEVGMMLLQKAQEGKKPVAIDITRNGQQLFHVGLPGSCADNDAWIIRKSNVVNRFGHSSRYVGMSLEQKGSTMEESSLLDSREYAAHGGSFPIIIKKTGVIGTITVSGLPSAEDHQLVVDVLVSYLGVTLLP